MTRLFRAPALLAAAALVAPIAQGAVPGPNDQLKLFPATYGRFAPKGNCTLLPRVTVSARAIRIETTAGAASFTHPNAVTNFMGPDDESITYPLQGPGEGLEISIKGKRCGPTAASAWARPNTPSIPQPIHPPPCSVAAARHRGLGSRGDRISR